MTTEARDYAHEICRALTGAVFACDPEAVQPLLDAACAEAVRADRARLEAVLDAAAGVLERTPGVGVTTDGVASVVRRVKAAITTGEDIRISLRPRVPA